MQETEMDFENRIITSDFTPEDNDIENSLRPKTLDDYIGQDKICLLYTSPSPRDP